MLFLKKVCRLGAVVLFLNLGVCVVEAHRPEDMVRVKMYLLEDSFSYEITTHFRLLDPIRREQANTVTVKHQRAVEKFFADKMPLMIDDVEIPPVLENFEVMDREWVVRQFEDEDEDANEMSSYKARIARFRITYPIKGIPHKITMRWSLFPSAGESVVHARFYGDKKRISIFFEEGEPEYIWHHIQVPPSAMPVQAPTPIRVPAVPIVALLLGVLLFLPAIFVFKWPKRVVYLGAAGLILVSAGGWKLKSIELKPVRYLSGEQKATSIFETALQNIYHAFDHELEADIYAALAQSVDRNLQDKTYLDTYESLIMRKSGGAVCAVESVKILEMEVELPKGVLNRFNSEFKVNSTWEVQGGIAHRGHAHKRHSQYKGTHTLRSLPEGWRMVAMEMLEQTHHDTTTRVRDE